MKFCLVIIDDELKLFCFCGIKYGFLPLLENKSRTFLRKNIPLSNTFAEDVDGPWDWRDPVIRETGYAYGKFFAGRAGFISCENGIEISQINEEAWRATAD